MQLPTTLIILNGSMSWKSAMSVTNTCGLFSGNYHSKQKMGKTLKFAIKSKINFQKVKLIYLRDQKTLLGLHFHHQIWKTSTIRRT